MAIFLIVGGIAAIVAHFTVGERFLMDQPTQDESSNMSSIRQRLAKRSPALAGVVMIVIGTAYLLFHE